MISKDEPTGRLCEAILFNSMSSNSPDDIEDGVLTLTSIITMFASCLF